MTNARVSKEMERGEGSAESVSPFSSTLVWHPPQESSCSLSVPVITVDT